jgi:hypothetical protein
MNNSEEISIISKLINQQNGLMDALTDCHSLKKQLSSQFIKILKSIVLKNNGVLIIEKEFFDSADDEEITLNIETDEEENVILEIVDAEEEDNEQ